MVRLVRIDDSGGFSDVLLLSQDGRYMRCSRAQVVSSVSFRELGKLDRDFHGRKGFKCLHAAL